MTCVWPDVSMMVNRIHSHGMRMKSNQAMRILKEIMSFWISSKISIQMTTSEKKMQEGVLSTIIGKKLDYTTTGVLRLCMINFVKSIVEKGSRQKCNTLDRKPKQMGQKS